MKFTDPDVRPVVPAPLFENIPQEIRSRDQWVNWRYEWREKEWAKIPVNSETGRWASTTDPSTWSTFEAARARYEADTGDCDGIGYVFAESDPYFGADFDDCIKEGKIDQSVTKWVERFDSYTEKSVSGTGNLDTLPY